MSRILIIEDEPIIRSSLKRLLERNGYQVNEAGSVQQALDSYSPADFSLIISDLRLPGSGADHDQLCQPAFGSRQHEAGCH